MEESYGHFSLLWVFFTLFKFYKSYQVAQHITYSRNIRHIFSLIPSSIITSPFAEIYIYIFFVIMRYFNKHNLYKHMQVEVRYNLSII